MGYRFNSDTESFNQVFDLGAMGFGINSARCRLRLLEVGRTAAVPAKFTSLCQLPVPLLRLTIGCPA